MCIYNYYDYIYIYICMYMIYTHNISPKLKRQLLQLIFGCPGKLKNLAGPAHHWSVCCRGGFLAAFLDQSQTSFQGENAVLQGLVNVRFWSFCVFHWQKYLFTDIVHQFYRYHTDVFQIILQIFIPFLFGWVGTNPCSPVDQAELGAAALTPALRATLQLSTRRVRSSGEWAPAGNRWGGYGWW